MDDDSANDSYWRERAADAWKDEMASKVVSDGNGGLKIKESLAELLRKWLSPILLGVLVWMGKAAVAELISLHDGQILMRSDIAATNTKINAVAVQASATEARVANLDARIPKGQ